MTSNIGQIVLNAKNVGGNFPFQCGWKFYIWLHQVSYLVALGLDIVQQQYLLKHHPLHLYWWPKRWA